MDKNNENRNENLSFITDEDALTEIDFGSFLEETSKDAPLFEGFHEDIERTEKSLESELQSLYDDIMNSGPATIVPKPLSVITAEPEVKEEINPAESGLNEMWMSPEEYIDIPVVMLDEPEDGEYEQEFVPEEAFFRPELQTEEAYAFAAESLPEAETEFAPAFEPIAEPEEDSTDSDRDDIFGLIDQMKNSADEETGFDDILAEIESNTGIAPVANDYDAIQDFLRSFPVETPAEQPQEMSYQTPVYQAPEAPVYQQPEAFAYQQSEAPVYQEADVISDLSAPQQEETINTDSEEFERELAALLGEEETKAAQETAQEPVQEYVEAPVQESYDSFVVNIPDDGYDDGIPDEEINCNVEGDVSESPAEPDFVFVFDNPEASEDVSGLGVPVADEAVDVSGAFDAMSTPEEQRAAVFFDPNMVGGYSQLPEEQADRVVIGDFEAAKKAAIEASAVETKKEKKARKKQEKKDRKNGKNKPITAGEVVRRIVLTLSFMVMIVCAGILVNTYLVQPKIAEENISEQNSQLEEGEDKYGDAPVDDAIREEYDVNFPEGMMAKYTQLYQQNADLRGWISIPAFEMNLPLVQGDNNSYYLKRNFYKKWVSYGVPFFDYRIEEEQFKTLPRNTVVYGHNMRSDDLIFGMLEEYRDIDGFKRAPIIECNTIYGDFKWVVCGVFISNSDPKHDNGYVFPYNFIDCSDQLFAEYIVELQKRSLYNTGVGLEVTDKILTLSTCAYDFKDARLVVVARLLRPGESVNVDTSKAVVNSDPKGPQAWCDELNKPNNYAEEKHWYVD